MKKSVWVLGATVSAIALSGQAAYAQDATEEEDAVGETIVVTGIRASLEDAINTKRNADAIVDAISAEDIGKFPDRNVAESLQRVPGVVTNREFGEGERVSLRGLAPNQTRTLVNGHAVATADWFVLDQQAATRNFNYLVLPSDVVGELQVFKSPTADIEEGGIGGTINVLTRKPLDIDPFVATISVEGAYTEKADSLDPQVSGVVSWSNPAGTFGVLAAGVYQKRNIRRDGFEILGYDSALDPSGQELQVPTLIGSALFLQERERYGGNLELQFRPTDQIEFGISGLWTRFNANNTNYNYLGWPARSGLGGTSGVTLTDTQVEGDTVVAGRIEGIAGASGFGQVYDIFDREAFAETRYIAGNWSYATDGGLTVSGQAGYTDAQGDTVRQPFVEFLGSSDFSFDLTGRAPIVSFDTVDPTNPDDLAFEFASNHSIGNDDSEIFAYLDFEQELDLGVLQAVKTGFKYTEHDRATDFQATTYGDFFVPFRDGGCGGVCTPSSFGNDQTPADYAEKIALPGSLTDFFLPTPSLIRDQIGAFPAASERLPLYSEIFSVNEKTYGGYVMGKFGGDGWRGNAGVRIVHTDQTSSGYIQGAEGEGQVSNAYGDFLPVTEERGYTDILPSLNMTFDLTDNFILRAAAARTLTRPDFTDIAPRVTLNPGALTGSGGSADVEPYRANQFDLSFEYYLPNRGLLAMALYYKDVSNFVTDRVSNESFAVETAAPDQSRCVPTPGSTNPDLYDCQFSINRRANGGSAEVKGVELIAQMPVYGNFGINANYSYSDAETDNGDPVPGNSKHALQAGAYYEDSFVSAQVTYNWRDDFFITLDRATSLNQKSFGSLDASLDLRVTEFATLTFDAVNLTNEKIVQFAGEEFRPRAIYDNGRYFFFGARFEY